MSFRNERMPSPSPDQPAMRAWTNASIFAIAPIEQIMTGLMAGPGMIGDLIGREPGPLGQILGDVVELSRQIFGRQDELSRRCERRKCRVRLYGELIERHVTLL